MPDPHKPARPRDIFAERHARCRDRLSPGFRKVAEFIDANRSDVLTLSALDLGRASGTSVASEVRVVQALGFAGLQDLRAALADPEHTGTAADSLSRAWADGDQGAEAAMDGVILSLLDTLPLLRSGRTRHAMLDALRILHMARRIVVFGVGPTAHIARYFAARLRRKGRRQLVLDQTGTGLADQLLDLEPGAAVLMLACGRPGSEAGAVMAEAAQRRVPVVLIADSARERPARTAAVTLEIPRRPDGRVTLHSATVACLEMLLVGLASSDRSNAVDTLKELERLRKLTRPG